MKVARTPDQAIEFIAERRRMYPSTLIVPRKNVIACKQFGVVHLLKLWDELTYEVCIDGFIVFSTNSLPDAEGIARGLHSSGITRRAIPDNVAGYKVWPWDDFVPWIKREEQ